MPVNLLTERKFIIYESKLMELLHTCANCDAPTSTATKVIGSLLQVKQSCPSCSHIRYWESLPYVNKTPAGNLAISAAILSSGSLPMKTLRLFEFINCAIISENTLFRHQECYMHTAISNVWKKQQE